MPRRPRICLIAYWFPPLRAAGSLRAYHLARRAQELGFDVTVISVATDRFASPKAADGEPDVSQFEIFRTRTFDLNEFLRSCAALIRRKRGPSGSLRPKPNRPSGMSARLRAPLYYLYKNVVCFPDQWLGWHFLAKRRVLGIVQQQRPDAVVCTGPPFTSFLLGRAIKRRFPKIKWIADFRDLWSQSEVYVRPAPLRRIEQELERRVLCDADLLVTISDVARQRLERLHPDKRVVTVYNGYDGDVNETSAEVPCFTLTYTGVLYESANRDPSMLLLALRDLSVEGSIDPDVFRFRIYGNAPAPFVCRVEQLGLTHLVEFHAPVGRREIRQIQCRSNALVLIEWSADALPVKLYEYLATGVPLLTLARPGSEIHRVSEMTGKRLLGSKDEVKAFVLREYEYWKATGRNRVTPVPDEVRMFSRENQSRRLVEAISSLVAFSPSMTGSPISHASSPIPDRTPTSSR